MTKPKFEDYLDVIDLELRKRRSQWHLHAINWIAYEDIEQIIRFHIFKKFGQYDKTRPIGPWIGTIVNHQLYNVIRNTYTNYTKPCMRCDASEGDNLCSIYTTQCSSCPIYAKWEKTKKSAYDTKLPLPIENHQQEVFSLTSEKIDIERSAENLHEKMKSILKPIEWKIYNWLYIEHKTEEQVAKLMSYKTTESGRRAGYNSIRTIKKSIVKKAKKLIYNGGVDFVNI